VTTTELDFVNFDIVTPPTGYTYANLNLQRWQGGSLHEQYAISADAGSTSVDHPVAQTYNTWTHVALDVDFGAQTYSLAVDGVTASVIALTPQLPRSAFDLGVGITYTGGASAPWTVWIDNVVVDQN
jgi:hypothetical protein